MHSEKKSLPQGEQLLLDRAEKLIWSLLDDQITEEDVKRLEELIQKNDCVRFRYLECVQIHADLFAHYKAGPAAPTPVQSPVQSPVLGTLMSDSSSPLGGSASLVD